MPDPKPILALLAALTLGACSQPSPTETATVNVSPARQAPSTNDTSAQQAAPQAEPALPEQQPAPPTTQPTTQPATQPATQTPADDTEWWLRTPEPVEGRVRIVASATAATLIEARQQAVTNARDLLARSLGHEPDDATIERTSAVQGADDAYTAWVLISAPSN
ncbi:MAG: hypothetical protein ACF8Q5_01475 [Phycisphaerales bacterium JB040]